jgi:hypothetical protein
MLLASSVCGLFRWRQFEPEVILLAVGWYLRFSLSYRDAEELLANRVCTPIMSPTGCGCTVTLRKWKASVASPEELSQRGARTFS